MHDTTSMLADLMEAINDAPVGVTIIHRGGHQSVLSTCAVSDISASNRLIDDEGIMESADISITYATKDARRTTQNGEKVIYSGTTYRVLRVTRDRIGVSTTLECKEEQ